MKRNSLITLSALALLGLSGTVLAADPGDRVDARLPDDRHHDGREDQHRRHQVQRGAPRGILQPEVPQQGQPFGQLGHLAMQTNLDPNHRQKQGLADAVLVDLGLPDGHGSPLIRDLVLRKNRPAILAD